MLGASNFPFRTDPFLEGTWHAVKMQEATKVVSLATNGGKIGTK